MESLACPAFTTMLTYIHLYKDKVLKVAEAFLKEFEAGTGTIKDLPPAINLVLGRFRRIASAVVALLHPLPGHLKSSAADVNDLRKYKGSEVQEASVKTIFIAQEVNQEENPAANQKVIAMPNPWVKLYDELITKGQFTLTNLPQLEAIREKLEKAEEKAKTDTLGIDWKDFESVITEFPPLSKGMRDGICTEHLQKLRLLVMSVAQDMLKIKDEDALALHGFSQHHVAILHKGLKLFETYPGFAKLTRDLGAWAQRGSSMLSKGGLKTLCKSYPNDPEEDPAADSYPTMKTVDKFCEIATKCGKDIVQAFKEGDEGATHLARALAWNIHVIRKVTQAGYIIYEESWEFYNHSQSS